MSALRILKSPQGDYGEGGGTLEGRVSRLEERVNHLATKADLADLKASLVKWFVVTGIGVAGVIVAAMKL